MDEELERTSNQLLLEGYELATQLASAAVLGERAWAAEETKRMMLAAGMANAEGMATREAAVMGATVLELVTLICRLHHAWAGVTGRDPVESWEWMMSAFAVVGPPVAREKNDE